MTGPDEEPDGGVHLRQATATDAPALVPLLAQLGYPSSTAQIEGRLRRLLGDESSTVVVASRAGRLIGVSVLHVTPLLEHDRPVGQLIALAVDHDHRRQGIGRSLVEAIEREASARGCCALILNSGDHRADAHRFYETLGYRATGRRFTKYLDNGLHMGAGEA